LSPRDSKTAGGPYRKPRADVYTMLLILALMAIIAGIVFLYLQMDVYQFQFKGGPSVRAAPAGQVDLARANRLPPRIQRSEFPFVRC
jgi:hypothetical protein